MTDGHARRLLALVASSMSNEEHKRARLLLLRTDWLNEQGAIVAIDALATLTHVSVDVWTNALRDQMRRSA
jgi:hypothetical protein